jgi:glycosyltransferase involved in cell wall biosynthesis
VGGLEFVSFEQARRLVQYGYQVTFVSSKTLKNVPRTETIEGVYVHRVPTSTLLERMAGIQYPIFAPSIFPILTREIKASDICMIHSFGFISSLIAAFICRKHNIPYILYQHNNFIPYHNAVLNILQSANDLVAGHYVLRHATVILAVSQSTVRYITGLIERDVEVLYGAVDHLLFFNDGACLLKRNKLGLPLDKFVVLTARRLVFKNAVDTLIHAAQRLKDDPRIIFVVIGDGPERHRIESFIADQKLQNCILVGEVSSTMLADYYRASNLFVLPSRSEGLGIVLLEAMSCGLPVIATLAGGQVELVQESINGFLVEPDSPEQIAALIKRYVDKPEILEEMGRQGYDMVREKFTWDKHMRQLLATIEKVMDGTRRDEQC